MANWAKVGTDVVVGAAAGALDQVIQNQDDKRMVAAVSNGKKLSVMSQYGTYLN